METSIFYFSGTGNSLKVARDIADSIPQSRLISIPLALRQGFDAKGRIGIVFPVYMFGLPLIVSEFIRKLKSVPGNYIFGVLTLGGLAGGALDQLRSELAVQGIVLSAGFLVTMPGNYTPLYQAIAPNKQKKIFAKQHKRTEEIARIVMQGATHHDRGFSLLNGLLKRLYKAGAPKIPFLDKDFWSQDSCTSCGMCRDVCPVNNIEIIEGRPRWRHTCQQCFACLQWCPPEAIQYGKRTIGRRRYRNPDVGVADIINSK
jgi:ferredoxin